LGGAALPKQVFQTISRDLAVPSNVLEEKLGSGASKFENHIAWARRYLVVTGFIDGSRRGVWKLTDKGWTTDYLSDEVLRAIVDETQARGKAPPAGDEADDSETSTDELDIKTLKDLYDSDSVARQFLEHLASRKRNQSETSVERALQILKKDGHDVVRQQIVTVFRALENCGCGQFVSGRRGWPSRFVWSTAMIGVGRAAAGEQPDVEAFLEGTTETEGRRDWLTHSFHLRPDVTLEIELPADLTVHESERIARFVQALPFDSDS